MPVRTRLRIFYISSFRYEHISVFQARFGPLGVTVLNEWIRIHFVQILHSIILQHVFSVFLFYNHTHAWPHLDQNQIRCAHGGFSSQTSSFSPLHWLQLLLSLLLHLSERYRGLESHSHLMLLLCALTGWECWVDLSYFPPGLRFIVITFSGVSNYRSKRKQTSLLSSREHGLVPI